MPRAPANGRTPRRSGSPSPVGPKPRPDGSAPRGSSHPTRSSRPTRCSSSRDRAPDAAPSGTGTSRYPFVPTIARTAAKDVVRARRASAFADAGEAVGSGAMRRSRSCGNTTTCSIVRARRSRRVTACRSCRTCTRRRCGRRAGGACTVRDGAGCVERCGRATAAARERCRRVRVGRSGRRAGPPRRRPRARAREPDGGRRHTLRSDRLRRRGPAPASGSATRSSSAGSAAFAASTGSSPSSRRSPRSTAASPRRACCSEAPAPRWARCGISPSRSGIADAVVLPGAIAHTDMPEFIAAMDVAVVSARPDAGFHYSPLKLREYMACGVPVVAPRLGEIPRTVHDGEDALLHPPGDSRSVGRSAAAAARRRRTPRRPRDAGPRVGARDLDVGRADQ